MFEGARIEAIERYGAVMMPPGDYGFSRRFAWCSDRFGVSWQLNVPAIAASNDRASK